MEREHEREEFQQEIRSLEEQLRRAARPPPRDPSDSDVSRPRCHARGRRSHAAPSSAISTHAPAPMHADGGAWPPGRPLSHFAARPAAVGDPPAFSRPRGL